MSKSFWSFTLDQEDIKKQIDQYDTLKITQSYRGISALLLVFSSVVTIILATFNVLGLNSSAYFDATIFATLAVLVYKGYGWAILAAMIVWTLEKVYQVAFLQSSPMVGVVWWVLYIQMFYKAWSIERIRKTRLSTIQT
jgi:hypothetical protein